MSSTSRFIPMTIRLENELYKEFHRTTKDQGSTHTGVIRVLVERWLVEQRMALKWLDGQRKKA